MPTFAYKALSKTGQRTEGVVDAADRLGALTVIERMGLVPVSVIEGRAAPASRGAGGRRFRLSTPDRMARVRSCCFRKSWAICWRRACRWVRR